MKSTEAASHRRLTSPSLPGLQRLLLRSAEWLMLTAYKGIVSPLLHIATGHLGACRFQPTCSEYALLAVSTRGLVRGSLLACTRCLRCNPLFAGGFDPVPGTYSSSSPSHEVAKSCGDSEHECMHTSPRPVTME